MHKVKYAIVLTFTYILNSYSLYNINANVTTKAKRKKTQFIHMLQLVKMDNFIHTLLSICNTGEPLAYPAFEVKY